MRQREITRLITMVLRRTSGKQRVLFTALLVAGAIAYAVLQPVLAKRGINLPEIGSGGGGAPTHQVEAASPGEQAIVNAFNSRQSDLIVQATAVVVKNLRDDTTGSQHQKMLLELPSGLTLLCAHNIDLAPRVPADEGDTIEFKGEYEYSEKGGVIHWTHHDPRGRHEDGWLKHEGKTYK